ncbi:m18 family aminopeptidase 1-related [Anaeramoeba ignava]|uniref:M18 family aminopeptidase 1-related n=1 Tax=Anaeramoeba ignava TaxID=1746090 RepID=A0A9Q0LC90_ANAIG|nr:m18 family aminopeptidase 1-related [Anaeramoeba ignava]
MEPKIIQETDEKEKEDISKKLLFKRKHGFDSINQEQFKEIMDFAEMYKNFISFSKTERECIDSIKQLSKQNGFVNIKKAKKEDQKLFFEFDKVCGGLAYIKDPNDLENGFLILGSHIDSPRLDLKQMPIYETLDMCYAKTHYYGGIKKYQWVTRPLALHGVVVLTSGEVVNIVIGEAETDPVFTINDLLPHLAQQQSAKSAKTVIEGENLNILIGSVPYNFQKKSNSVKLNILNILNQKYGIVEEDFISAELELVPAGLARDVGLDLSFVGGYGQDDRVCSFCGMQALFNIISKSPELISKNLMIIFFDKEEIGSQGNSGANSNLVERIFNSILYLHGKTEQNSLINSLANSQLLSADVNVGIDPEWRSVCEENNCAKIGYGVALTKFTGSGGKSNSNEAHAEFVARIRKAFNQDGVLYQPAELGKVDQGGGGTIAKYLASYGMQVCDCGTPVLSMHAPFEISSKADVFHTYKAYLSFYKLK